MLDIFFKVKKFFCYKKLNTSKKSIISIKSENCKNLYYDLLPLQHDFTEFLVFFLNLSKEKEIENLISLENIIDENIFTQTFDNFDKTTILEILNKKNYFEELYNSIFNFINYLSLKSCIIINQKKWNIFKIKKLLLKEKNCEKCLEILKKKLKNLYKINNFLKKSLISNFLYENLSKSKRRKLFIKSSLKIFKIILLFSLKIKNFKETEKITLVELIQKLIEINEFFSYLKKKTTKNYKISKIENITGTYLVNILQNLRYFILDTNLENFKIDLKKIIKSLFFDFPEETENLMNEISCFILKGDIELSTIYEESHFSESFSVNNNESYGSINKRNDGYYSVKNFDKVLKVEKKSLFYD